MGNEIKILIFSKKGTSKGKTFFNYRTSMKLIVKGEEDKGLQKRTVDVKFRQSAKIDGKNLGKDYLRGILTCESTKVDAPTIYAIKETTNDDGDVVLKYPAVWVSEVISYEETAKEAKQSAFVLEDDEPEAEETDLGGSDD
jgi:hypothetical protein